MPFRVLWRSLLDTGSVPEGTVIWVLHDSGLSSASQELLASVVAKSGFQIELRNVPAQPEGYFPLGQADHVSLATYHRLFVHELLSASVGSVVYLDVDTVAVGSIRYLFELEISRPIAAVDHIAGDSAYRLWGSRLGTYFQAGVLVIDLDAWRGVDVSRIFVGVLDEYRHKILWWDQDILNLAFRDNWQRLPIWFNVNPSVRSVVDSAVLEKNAKLVHYSGDRKPWNRDPVQVTDSVYWHNAFSREFGERFTVATRHRVGFLGLGRIRARFHAALSALSRGV